MLLLKVFECLVDGYGNFVAAHAPVRAEVVAAEWEHVDLLGDAGVFVEPLAFVNVFVSVRKVLWEIECAGDHLDELGGVDAFMRLESPIFVTVNDVFLGGHGDVFSVPTTAVDIFELEVVVVVGDFLLLNFEKEFS